MTTRTTAELTEAGREALADAWDEGHRAGELDGSYRLAVHSGFRAPAPSHANPYRAAPSSPPGP